MKFFVRTFSAAAIVVGAASVLMSAQGQGGGNAGEHMSERARQQIRALMQE